MHTILFLLVSLMLAVSGFSQEQSLTVATLNCYRFFNGEEGKSDIDKPRSSLEYSTKAGHLIGLLPKEAPLFVGFQEIGGGEDLAALASLPRRDTVAAIRRCSLTGPILPPARTWARS